MRIIHTGLLQKQNKEYHVRHLELDNLPLILALQDIVFGKLEDKKALEKLSEEEYTVILEGKGMLIGAFVQDELVAIRALLVPPIDEHHLGRYAGLDEKELDKVIYQEISLVHPDYRGNRLQQQLARIIMDELRNREEQFRYVCATVAPFNIPSIKDKFNQGMRVVALDKVYGEKLRYVFMKDLRLNSTPSLEMVETVSMGDIGNQQNLLQAGWVGFELVIEGEDLFVRYGKGEPTS